MNIPGNLNPFGVFRFFPEKDPPKLDGLHIDHQLAGGNHDFPTLQPPPILAPLLNSEQFSAEDLAAMLTHLQSKTTEAQLRTAHETLTMARSRMETANADAVSKIDEANKKAQSAASKAKVNGILGWIGRAAAVVGATIAVVAAIAATVVTGGAALPLVVVAAVALVAATISMADAISQERGGPSLTVSSLMSKACSAAFDLMGMNKEDAEKYGKFAAGAIGTFVLPGLLLLDPTLAGNLMGGIATIAGEEEQTVMVMAAVATVVATLAAAALMIVMTAGTGVAASAGKTMTTVTTALQASLGVMQGGMSVTNGSLTIAKAVDDRDVAHLGAAKKKIDALLIKLQGQMEEQKEDIQKVIEELMDSYKVVMQMFSTAASSRQQVTANIGGRNAMI